MIAQSVQRAERRWIFRADAPAVTKVPAITSANVMLPRECTIKHYRDVSLSASKLQRPFRCVSLARFRQLGEISLRSRNGAPRKFRYIGSVTRERTFLVANIVADSKRPRGDSPNTILRKLPQLPSFLNRFSSQHDSALRLISFNSWRAGFVPFAVNNYGNKLMLCERNINICGFPVYTRTA